jgi:hypothetical protein
MSNPQWNNIYNQAYQLEVKHQTHLNQKWYELHTYICVCSMERVKVTVRREASHTDHKLRFVQSVWCFRSLFRNARTMSKAVSVAVNVDSDTTDNGSNNRNIFVQLIRCLMQQCNLLLHTAVTDIQNVVRQN